MYRKIPVMFLFIVVLLSAVSCADKSEKKPVQTAVVPPGICSKCCPESDDMSLFQVFFANRARNFGGFAG